MFRKNSHNLCIFLKLKWGAQGGAGLILGYLGPPAPPPLGAATGVTSVFIRLIVYFDALVKF